MPQPRPQPCKRGYWVVCLPATSPAATRRAAAHLLPSTSTRTTRASTSAGASENFRRLQINCCEAASGLRLRFFRKSNYGLTPRLLCLRANPHSSGPDRATAKARYMQLPLCCVSGSGRDIGRCSSSKLEEGDHETVYCDPWYASVLRHRDGQRRSRRATAATHRRRQEEIFFGNPDRKSVV